MPKYEVTDRTDLKFKKKIWTEGDIVEMSKEEAQHLLDSGTLVPAGKGSGKAAPLKDEQPKGDDAPKSGDDAKGDDAPKGADDPKPTEGGLGL